MDADVVRIDELVSEACGLLKQARWHTVPDLETELECLRAHLAQLAGRVGQVEAADTACAVARDIDAALRSREVSAGSRAA
jgi:hypothetical protein